MTLPRLGAVGEILARPVPAGWDERERANQRCVPTHLRCLLWPSARCHALTFLTIITPRPTGSSDPHANFGFMAKSSPDCC